MIIMVLLFSLKRNEAVDSLAMARVVVKSPAPTPVVSNASQNSTGGIKLPSITSSEYVSRLEALEIQLKEERRRRKNVEDTISLLRNDGGVNKSSAECPVAMTARNCVNPTSVLTELSLFLLQKEVPSAVPQRPPSVPASSPREVTPAGAKKQHPQATNAAHTHSIPKPPELQRDANRSPTASSGRKKQLSSARTLVSQGRTEWVIPERVKPPLPPQAKGNNSCEATPLRYSKKRASEVDVYLTKQRHENRINMLMNFQLGPF